MEVHTLVNSKILPSIRVSERTLENVKSAILKYNSKSLFQINEAEFRRLALELLSQMILLDVPLPVNIKIGENGK